MKTIVYFIGASAFSDEECARRARFLQRFVPDGVHVEVRAQPSGLGTLDPPDYAARVESDTAAQIGRFRPPDVDAVVLGVALDVGLREARAGAVVPVVGPGEASLFVASLVGVPLAVVAVDRMTADVAEHFVRSTPAKPNVVAVRCMETPLDIVVRDPNRAREALRRECRRAAEDNGARAIYLGAMTLSMLDGAAAIPRELGLRVFDPAPIAMAAAVQCVRTAGD